MTCNGSISVRTGLLCCLGLAGVVTLAATAQDTGVAPPKASKVTTSASGGRMASKEEGGIAGAANDVCLGAVALVPDGPSVTDSTVGATIDVVPACAPFAPAGPGVWFSVVGNGNTLIVDTCGGATNYDTAISVFSGTCAALVCVGGQDDFCGLQTRFSWPSVNGTTYRILLFGFAGATGTAEISVENAPPPPVCNCSPSTEGEPDCFDEYVDATNGGCNSTPAVFSTITANTPVCGRGGTYLFGGAQYRDTDWYQYAHGGGDLTIEAAGEFDLRLFLLTAVCPTTVIATATSGTPCTTVTISSPGLAAGNYYIFAGTNVFTGVPCGSDYILEAIAIPPCPADIDGPGAGQNPDGVVNIEDLLFLLSSWGNCPS